MPDDKLVVSDTSPLLNLALIDRLDLVRKEFFDSYIGVVVGLDTVEVLSRFVGVLPFGPTLVQKRPNLPQKGYDPLEFRLKVLVDQGIIDLVAVLMGEDVPEPSCRSHSIAGFGR